MDMCYDGALVLPSSYAVMDEESNAIRKEGGVDVKCLRMYVEFFAVFSLGYTGGCI